MSRRTTFWGSRRAALLLGVGLVATLLAANGSVAAASAGAAPRPVSTPTVSGVAVTWNGQNISTAGAVGSGFAVTVGESITVKFSFSFAPLSAEITTARLQVFYFGAALSTNQVQTSTGLTGHGNATMNWNFGSYTYLLEGSYRLTASLVDSNGTTVWSSSFYITERAPYLIGSGFAVFLLALGAFELYDIASLGRRARKRRARSGGSGPAPWSGPSTGGPAAPGGPGAPADAGAPPPLPPPAGGGGASP